MNTGFKECEGCAHRVNRCLLQHHPLVIKCPCINCLVKMICEKMCAPRIALYKRAFTHHGNICDSKRNKGVKQ